MKYKYSEKERIVRREMLQTLENFTKDDKRAPFISYDETEEEKYCKKMRKAAKMIYNYYSLPEDKIK
jgi:hypothetical protein